MKVDFEAEALIEYEEAAQYAEDRFGCGQKFVAAMRVALDSIAKDPTARVNTGRTRARLASLRALHFLR